MPKILINITVNKYEIKIKQRKSQKYGSEKNWQQYHAATQRNATHWLALM